MILFDTKDNIGLQAVFRADVFDITAADHINAAAVGSDDEIFIISFDYGKDLRVQNADAFTMGRYDLIITDDRYTARACHGKRTVRELIYRPYTVTRKPVLRRKNKSAFAIVAY